MNPRPKPPQTGLRFLRLSSTHFLIAATIVLGASATTFLAQQPTQDDDEVLRVSTDLLLFPIRVRDRRHDANARLTENDLALKDPDHVTSGLYFTAGADRVAFVFALDQSGSLGQIISQQRDAALALYSHFNEKSSIAVLRFAETPVVAADFNHETTSARAAFSFQARTNHHTAIFDAATRAIEMFEALPRVRSERRIVILISDGLDNASTTKASAAIELARNKRVSFYVIHLPLFEPRGGHLSVRRPAKGFRELAENTGGKYFLVSEPALGPARNADLTSVFAAIEEDLRNQYLLGFYLNDKANDGARHVFSLALPAGFEYRYGPADYSRSHKFFVLRPHEAKP